MAYFLSQLLRNLPLLQPHYSKATVSPHAYAPSYTTLRQPQAGPDFARCPLPLLNTPAHTHSKHLDPVFQPLRFSPKCITSCLDSCNWYVTSTGRPSYPPSSCPPHATWRLARPTSPCAWPPSSSALPYWDCRQPRRATRLVHFSVQPPAASVRAVELGPLTWSPGRITIVRVSFRTQAGPARCTGLDAGDGGAVRHTSCYVCGLQ